MLTARAEEIDTLVGLSVGADDYMTKPFSSRVLVARIRTRGRPKEKETPESYWATLHARYERWLADFRACPVLRLDVRGYDLVADPRAIEDIATRVREKLEPEIPQTELALV